MKLITRIRSSRKLYNIGYWISLMSFGIVPILFNFETVSPWIIWFAAALAWALIYVFIFYRPLLWSTEDRKKEGLDDIQ